MMLINNQFKLEPFEKTEANYAAGAAIWNAIFPLHAESAEDWARRDRIRDARYYKHAVCVSDVDSGAMVAYGDVRHFVDSFHPQKFLVEVLVHPSWEGQGIGRNLYTHLTDHVADQNPTILEGFTASDKARGIRFLEDRGFTLGTREYSSLLDLNQFDPTVYDSYTARAQADGIEFATWHQLAERHPEQWQRKLYDFINEIDRDIPWHDEITPEPYEQFLKKIDDQPHRIPGCFVVALDGDDYVGVTMVSKTTATKEILFTGMTGVKRTHRRKGLALALKQQSLGYAKAHFRTDDGRAPSVITENEENNPMFKINERLGFVRIPDLLNYSKKLS